MEMGQESLKCPPWILKSPKILWKWVKDLKELFKCPNHPTKMVQQSLKNPSEIPKHRKVLWKWSQPPKLYWKKSSVMSKNVNDGWNIPSIPWKWFNNPWKIPQRSQSIAKSCENDPKIQNSILKNPQQYQRMPRMAGISQASHENGSTIPQKNPSEIPRPPINHLVVASAYFAMARPIVFYLWSRASFLCFSPGWSRWTPTWTPRDL